MSEDRELARVRKADLWLEDHGWLVFAGEFVSENGSAQGLGVGMDADAIKRLMRVFRVEFFRQMEGRPCWVTRRNGMIRKVDPLFADEGTPFDLDVWAATLESDAQEKSE